MNCIHNYVGHAQTGSRNSQRVTAKHTILTLDAQLATINGELYTGTRQVIVEGVHLLLVQRGEGRCLESELVRNTVVVTQLLSELNIRLQSVVGAEGVVATGAGDGHPSNPGRYSFSRWLNSASSLPRTFTLTMVASPS